MQTPSVDSDISAQGRFVAFTSGASKLVAGDSNDSRDVFVRDRRTDVTRRVSVATGGAQGNNHSYQPAISADGRYVAFTSAATNLVAGDTNHSLDVFVRDRVAKVTRRVSVATGGVADNGDSFNPSISADGRYVAFESWAKHLVADDSNGVHDVFVRDRGTGTTSRVSVASDGTEGTRSSSNAAISADGQYVAFESFAQELVAGDTNGDYDVFVRNRETNTTTRVSVGPGGAQGDGYSVVPDISADGRYVSFTSAADNLVAVDNNAGPDIFVRDTASQLTTRVSVPCCGDSALNVSGQSAISADGRYVAFYSVASNLVTRDTNGAHDVFVRDRVAKVTERVSVTSRGAQANDYSYQPAISAHGRYVSFTSAASNLVAGDTNDDRDVFVRDRGGS